MSPGRMNDSTEVRSEEAIKDWGRCGTKAKVVDGRYKLFLVVLVLSDINNWLLCRRRRSSSEKLKQQRSTLEEFWNLSRQSQKGQAGRKDFPYKSLNVRSQNFFQLLMEMFFYLVDGFQVRIKNFIIFRVGIMSLIEILPVKRDKRVSVE